MAAYHGRQEKRAPPPEYHFQITSWLNARYGLGGSAPRRARSVPKGEQPPRSTSTRPQNSVMPECPQRYSLIRLHQSAASPAIPAGRHPGSYGRLQNYPSDRVVDRPALRKRLVESADRSRRNDPSSECLRVRSRCFHALRFPPNRQGCKV